MTTIKINNFNSLDTTVSGVKSIDFNYLGEKVYSAKQLDRIVGVFISQNIWGDEKLITWKQLSYSAQKFSDTDIYVYVRSANTESLLESSDWLGPYLNSVNDISDFKGRFLQFMVVLINNGAKNYNYQYNIVSPSPILNSIDLTYLSSSNSSKFFTKAFNLSFAPKHLLLTYNGEVSDDSIVRFAISGFDSSDTNDYQYIDPNKIESMSNLSLVSNKIKIMIEMISDSVIPVTIYEFALMFSNEDQIMLNDESSESDISSSSIEEILIDPGEIWEFPVTASSILFEFTGDPLETATIILNNRYFVIGNIEGQFVWDIGGLNQYTFTYIGESISQIVGAMIYNIVWSGFGSLMFVIRFVDIMSSSSSESSSSSYSSSSSSSTLVKSSSSSSSSTLVKSSSSSSSSTLVKSSSSSSSSTFVKSSSSSSSSTFVKSSSSSSSSTFVKTSSSSNSSSSNSSSSSSTFIMSSSSSSSSTLAKTSSSSSSSTFENTSSSSNSSSSNSSSSSSTFIMSSSSSSSSTLEKTSSSSSSSTFENTSSSSNSSSSSSSSTLEKTSSSSNSSSSNSSSSSSSSSTLVKTSSSSSSSSSNRVVTYTSVIPPLDTSHVKASSNYDPPTQNEPWFTCDQGTSLTGAWANNQWLSASLVITNIKFGINLNSSNVIKRIYYENGFNGPSAPLRTNCGVKDVEFYGATDSTAFDAWSDYSNLTNCTLLWSGSFAQHAESNTADPKYITVTNSTSYQYYIFRFLNGFGGSQNWWIGVRRIELQKQS